MSRQFQNQLLQSNQVILRNEWHCAERFLVVCHQEKGPRMTGVWISRQENQAYNLHNDILWNSNWCFRLFTMERCPATLASLPDRLSGHFAPNFFLKYITHFWWRKHQFRLRLVNEIGRSIRKIVPIPSTSKVIYIRNKDSLSWM
jgi:hypothetical protein